MRSYVALVLAAGCASTPAAAPVVRAPHVEPVPDIIQPTFAPEVSAPAPHVSVSDPSQQISDDDRAALAAHLAHRVAREASGYAITATIARVNVISGRVACSVTIRIAPDDDGVEHWETDRTAIARGSAVATGGTAMIRACLVATVDAVIARQVLPFLRRRS